MAIGLSMVLKPISVLLDVLPILGDLVGMGLNLVAGIVAFVLSLLTIAIAWFFYRPVVSLIILAIAGGGFAAYYYLAKQKKAENAAKTA